MPSVRMPRKSTDTDMTPFVDIAFLLLTFFIMATKFKPEEPVQVETPNSVSANLLEENNSLLVTIDKDSKVYLNVNAIKDEGQSKLRELIDGVDKTRNLGLTDAEKQSFLQIPIIGVPFANLKGFLALTPDQQREFTLPGIPVLDSINNELVWWVDETKKAFAGTKLLYLVKGDNGSKFPSFEAVINALRRNEEFKYHLITSQEGAPADTELYQIRNQKK